MIEDVVRELGHLSLGTRLKRIGETLQAQTQAVLAAHGFDQPALHRVVVDNKHHFGHGLAPIGTCADLAQCRRSCLMGC